jgi:Uma2 family endonuclease
MSPTPSFQHQKIAFRLCRLLDDWVRPRQLGEVVPAPLDMVLSEHCVAQPDVVFIARERLDLIRRVVMGPADLVMEVVSLGSRSLDRIEKRDLYEQYGIKEYWLIDPEAKTVEVLFLDKGQYTLAGRFTVGGQAGSRLLPGFTVDVGSLFADLVGQE